MAKPDGEFKRIQVRRLGRAPTVAMVRILAPVCGLAARYGDTRELGEATSIPSMGAAQSKTVCRNMQLTVIQRFGTSTSFANLTMRWAALVQAMGDMPGPKGIGPDNVGA